MSFVDGTGPDLNEGNGKWAISGAMGAGGMDGTVEYIVLGGSDGMGVDGYGRGNVIVVLLLVKVLALWYPPAHPFPHPCTHHHHGSRSIGLERI